MIPDNGVILVFTDAGSIGLELENSIAEKARRKNVKIFFALLAAINRGTGKPVRKIIEKLLLSKNLTYRPPLVAGGGVDLQDQLHVTCVENSLTKPILSVDIGVEGHLLARIVHIKRNLTRKTSLNL